MLRLFGKTTGHDNSLSDKHFRALSLPILPFFAAIFAAIREKKIGGA
jgi:hypothetical protein